MTLVVAVFDQETMTTDIDRVTRALAAYDLRGDDVTLLAPSRGLSSSPATGDAVLPVVPLTSAAPNSADPGTAAAGPALVASGALDDLHLPDEEYTYFRSLVNEGAAVIFVNTQNEATAHSILGLFQRSRAARTQILR